MATKLSEGDTIAMQGEVTLVYDDGTVTVRLHDHDVPVTRRGKHLQLVAKRKAGECRESRCSTSRTERLG
jgi:hypothetical protein